MSLIIETELRALHDSSQQATQIIRGKGQQQHWNYKTNQLAGPVWQRQIYNQKEGTTPEVPAASLFEHVKDTEEHPIPSVAQCATHLKLLESFFVLKQTIFKSKALDQTFNAVETPRVVRRRGKDVKIKDNQFKAKREKKWPRFLEYAVCRFLIWWEKVDEVLEKMPGKMTEDDLPPLDVIMVWHSFLLNPQLFLESCMKHNRWALHKQPFPWKAIHASISSTTWHFTNTRAAINSFEHLTSQPADLVTYLERLRYKPTHAKANMFKATNAQVAYPVSRQQLPIRGYANIDETDIAFLYGCTLPCTNELHALLTAAVTRQFNFVTKMDSNLWLRSPTTLGTLTRARERYAQFLSLFRLHPGTMLVPTLDIDLVWHTHQCSPVAYKAACIARAGRFLDHDDKIGQGSLDDGLEVTKGLWRVRYGEEYERCCCWECEALFEKTEECEREGKEFGDKEAGEVAEEVAYFKEVEEARRKKRPLPVR